MQNDHDDPPVHPIAGLFPPLGADRFAALVADVRRNGLLEPIALLDGMILDGRSRWLACREAGVKPETVDLPKGSDPFVFVTSKNLPRSHLSKSQLAMIAARMTDMTMALGLGVDGKRAAQTMNVSAPLVYRARAVLERGTPEEIAAADAGKIGVAKLAKVMWERKSVKKAPAPANAATPPKPSKRRHGPILPDGETPESVARKVLEMREGGDPMTVVAEALQLDWRTCQRMADIVLIADRTDLPPREAEIAAAALRDMNERRVPLSVIVETIRPIAERLWGVTRAYAPRAEQEAARLDRFEHALGVMLQACSNAAKIEVPHLSPDDAKRTLIEIERAMSSVRILSGKIRSIHG